MREKARIKRICNKLAKLWLKHPDQRFYQLLINEGLLQDSPLWHIEDDKIEKHIEERIKCKK